MWKWFIQFHNQEPCSFQFLCVVLSLIFTGFTFFLGFTRNNNRTSSCGWTPWTSVIGNRKISLFQLFSLSFIIEIYVGKFDIWKCQIYLSMTWHLPIGTLYFQNMLDRRLVLYLNWRKRENKSSIFLAVCDYHGIAEPTFHLYGRAKYSILWEDASTLCPHRYYHWRSRSQMKWWACQKACTSCDLQTWHISACVWE